MSKAHDDQPFPIAEARRVAAAEPTKVKPQRPKLDLKPFSHKDPNVLIARLERRLTVADDQLNDAQEMLVAQTKYIAELEAYAGIEPAEAAPAAEPPAAS